MNVLLILLVILFSIVFASIGAILLELTGMDRSKARFQAISALTGTGFTTREAELISHHPQRRKIIISLMILGNAGIVILISSFVVSIEDSGILNVLGKLVIVVIGFYLIINRLKEHTLVNKMVNSLKQKLTERMSFEVMDIEELLIQQSGYGLVKLHIEEDSPIVGVTISNSGFREHIFLYCLLKERVILYLYQEQIINFNQAIYYYAMVTAQKFLIL